MGTGMSAPNRPCEGRITRRASHGNIQPATMNERRKFMNTANDNQSIDHGTIDRTSIKASMLTATLIL